MNQPGREEYTSPYWWWTRIKRRTVYPLHNYTFGTARERPIDVMNEDWDLLFVLDGCREDLFREVADIDRFDDYRAVQSGASATKKWVPGQFFGQAYSDTVYITGNAVVSEHMTAAFREFVDIWRDHDQRLIPPEPVADAVREQAASHPDKRIIAHFSQPHYPFLDAPELQFESGTDGPNNVWDALRQGVVEEDEVWSAYADNLRRALDVVLGLADEVTGKVVLTADHGNLIGERLWPVPLREYGHPPGCHHRNLTTVPWAVLDDDERREIDQGNEQAVTEQLEALGYR